jgi:hypothetical protein
VSIIWAAAELLVAAFATVVIIRLTIAILSQPETHPPAVDGEVKAQTYQALITHWNQQNTLLWSRVQTLLVLQVAVLAYVLSNAKGLNIQAFIIGFLGAVLTVVLGCIVNSDRRARDANLVILDRYAEQEHLPIRLKGPDGQNGTYGWFQPAWFQETIRLVGSQRALVVTIAGLGILDVLLVPLLSIL